MDRGLGCVIEFCAGGGELGFNGLLSWPDALPAARTTPQTDKIKIVQRLVVFLILSPSGEDSALERVLAKGEFYASSSGNDNQDEKTNTSYRWFFPPEPFGWWSIERCRNCKRERLHC